MRNRKKSLPFVAGGVALVVVAVAAVAFAGGAHKQAKADAATTTTTNPLPPPAPLTGVADPTGRSLHRCAVTVKIDNTSDGHPKYGVEQADVIYEEVVEGGITRLAAIFNSHAPDRVGPVRSVRKTDQSLVRPIGGIFAYSGGAPYAIASINTAPVVQLDETRAGPLMFRDNSRQAPWNLYAHVNEMYSKCKDPAPRPLFTYRKPGVKAGGAVAASAHVGFLNGYDVTWNWDAPSRTWKRVTSGGTELLAGGTQFAPRNVVVLSTSYVGGDPSNNNEGAEAELDGTGVAWVFTGGHVIKGTWSRPDPAKPAMLLNAAGREILLTPGQTWVELPDTGYTVTTTP